MIFSVNELKKYNKVVFISLVTLVLILSGMAISKYTGNPSIYILFTLVSNALLFMGFNKNAIFFDAFIGAFFWLGFWLKLTLRVAFSGGIFHEPVGNFDGSGAAFDQALIVTTCGILGLLLISLIRRNWFFSYPDQIEKLHHHSLFTFYKNNRKIILSAFVLLFTFIAISNAMLVIYQRGSITQTTLPFGLNGVYKWLLLFGLASFSALVLRFEFEIKKKTSLLVMFLSLLESFTTNVSLLSRGMILNSGALIYGVLISLKRYQIKAKLSFFVFTFLIFSVLFASSVLLVNYLRTSIYLDGNSTTSQSLTNTHAMTAPLFVDRWVGMEGVMAVSSYPHLSWDLFKTALKEKYNENDTSFYDNNIIDSAYENTDKTKHHFISLPGIVAFFYYPGSLLFLFFSMFALGGLAAVIEFCTYKLGGMNVILCALFAQVVAFRFASFGYVPAQSYLLLGSLFLNLLIIYFAERITRFLQNR
ncbi:hypothetical protein Meth11DRAFT_0847 [Methylophilaceae bacterium 11]|uniref:hypothetical protein n=1 Tax=Methylotenera sp. 1P/1 TaxID=1131551 RepID=UPI00037DEAC7|nr:hypothetical protein [Methylotenera sp. 1P/1]EUJ10036.1 hypothetical protein Meth11DRAFT_0847 [Methylophilaceae bacterium 11]